MVAISFQQNVVDCIICYFINTLSFKIEKERKVKNPDKISHKILKVSPKNIFKPVKTFYRKSFQQRKHLSDWKITKIIDISKKIEFFLPSIYRLISLLSCVVKVMERIV